MLERIEHLIESEALILIENVIELFQWHKRHIIGYFDSDDSEEYKTFKRIASVLRNDCQFHSASGQDFYIYIFVIFIFSDIVLYNSEKWLACDGQLIFMNLCKYYVFL